MRTSPLREHKREAGGWGALATDLVGEPESIEAPELVLADGDAVPRHAGHVHEAHESKDHVPRGALPGAYRALPHRIPPPQERAVVPRHVHHLGGANVIGESSNNANSRDTPP